MTWVLSSILKCRGSSHWTTLKYIEEGAFQMGNHCTAALLTWKIIKIDKDYGRNHTEYRKEQAYIRHLLWNSGTFSNFGRIYEQRRWAIVSVSTLGCYYTNPFVRIPCVTCARLALNYAATEHGNIVPTRVHIKGCPKTNVDHVKLGRRINIVYACV